MKLTIKDMDIATGGPRIIILNENDAATLDLHPADRLGVKYKRKHVVCIVDFAESKDTVAVGEIGLFEEVIDSLGAQQSDVVDIHLEKKPESIKYIKKKMDGGELSKKEILSIVQDIVDGKLIDIELTYYVAGNYINGMSKKEVISLTQAMIETGDVLKIPKKYPVLDKHCIGGIPGNRTTMIIVPILAAAGLCIPKTSSRAITSPAGTADTMEVLCDVSKTINEIKNIVIKENGCMAWGGAVNLAPADDTIINVEHPLSIDAEGQLLASIMAKKGSVSATHVLIDIPVGKTAKITNQKDADHLKKQFESIGKGLNMKIDVIITDGSQPIGNGIGPALEARDALWILQQHELRPKDLEEKCISMAGHMFELAKLSKKGLGVELARDILESGMAWEKMKNIIDIQGKKIDNPKKISFGKHTYVVKATRSGIVKEISNKHSAKVARFAGCPKDYGAGLYLEKHVGDKVKKNEVLFTIYSESKTKMKYAKEFLKLNNPYLIR